MTALTQTALASWAFQGPGKGGRPEGKARLAAGTFAVVLHAFVIGWGAMAMQDSRLDSAVETPVAAMEVTLMAMPAPVVAPLPPAIAPAPAEPAPEPEPAPVAEPEGVPPPPAVADEPVVPPPPPKRKPKKVVKAVRTVSAPAAVEAPSTPAPAPSSPSAPAPSVATQGEAPLVPPDVTAAYRANPPPVYPLIARRRGMEGVVLLRVLVAADGRVTEVEIAEGSGFAVLDQSALEAVRGWHFRPASRGGRAVEARVEVPIRFSLSGG